MRGNHYGTIAVENLERSIPAYAGEPPSNAPDAAI